MRQSISESSRRGSHFLLWTGLGLGLFGAVVLGLSVGSVPVPLGSVLKSLFGGQVGESFKTIVVSLRLPRVLTALGAGCALASSGLLMQTMFENALAGPSVLGISSGSSLGAAFSILLFRSSGMWGKLGLVGCSFLGAFLSMFLVAFIGNRIKKSSTLLILGLMIGYGSSAVVAVLLQWAPSELVQNYVSWSFGTFASVAWDGLPWLYSGIGAGFIIGLFGWRYWDVLLLGEDCASLVGADTASIRRFMILAVSLMSGSVTAFCGPVAFMGVAVPHISRIAVKSGRHKILVPVSALIGGILAIFSDLLCRLPGGGAALPLNAVTSLLGAPVVAWVVLKGEREP